MKKALWTPATKGLVQDSIEGLLAAVPHLHRVDGFPEVSRSMPQLGAACLAMCICAHALVGELSTPAY